MTPMRPQLAARSVRPNAARRLSVSCLRLLWPHGGLVRALRIAQEPLTPISSERPTRAATVSSTLRVRRGVSGRRSAPVSAGHGIHKLASSTAQHNTSTSSNMFFQRATSIAFALLALVAVSSDAANLRSERRLGATYSADSADWKQAMLQAVNTQRANNGLSALCLNSKLTSAAQAHSDDMAANNYMDHNGADGSTMSSRITATGYDWTYIEENVAAGQVDVDAVMTSWMNSEGHRANILGADVTMFGCGYAYNADTEYGHYWTQDFGASSTDACDSASSASTSSATTTSSDEVAGEADTTAVAAETATDATSESAAPAATPAATTAAPVATEAPVTTAEAPVATTEAPVATPAATTSGCNSYF